MRPEQSKSTSLDSALCQAFLQSHGSVLGVSLEIHNYLFGQVFERGLGGTEGVRPVGDLNMTPKAIA